MIVLANLFFLESETNIRAKLQGSRLCRWPSGHSNLHKFWIPSRPELWKSLDASCKIPFLSSFLFICVRIFLNRFCLRHFSRHVILHMLVPKRFSEGPF